MDISDILRRILGEVAADDPGVMKRIEYMKAVEELNKLLNESLGAVKTILEGYNPEDTSISSMKRNVLLHEQVVLAIGYNMSVVQKKADEIKAIGAEIEELRDLQ